MTLNNIDIILIYVSHLPSTSSMKITRYSHKPVWFRIQHSTLEQVHSVVDAILETFEEEKLLFIYVPKEHKLLSSAVSQDFDNVWHQGLPVSS